jgi:glycosyltransferase involved in cell wall biosynthesis
LLHLNNSITRHHEWMCAAWLAGVPCVVSERGINGRYTVLDRGLARRLAVIIPVSCWVMNHMVRHGVAPDNMRVLYDGIDAGTIKPARSADAVRDAYGVDSRQPVVGIVGNVRAWKGQETVVRAIIEVVKVFPDVVCFFVGASTPEDKPYLDQLQGLIKSAGIESNVRFTGYQSDPASFINIMQIVIHASIQPEPFGMVVLEAMAQRKPVIGSRAGGPVEMVQEGETGYTYQPGDAVALAARIVELLGNPDKAAGMGEAGYRRLMSTFTLEGYMADIHTVYRAILNKQALPADTGIRFSQDQHAAT